MVCFTIVLTSHLSKQKNKLFLHPITTLNNQLRPNTFRKKPNSSGYKLFDT